MDTRGKSNAEFRNEIHEILGRHESKLNQLNATLQVVLTELRAFKASHLVLDSHPAISSFLSPIATSATKPSDNNPSVENPKQTLGPVAPPSTKTDHPQDLTADSSSAPPSSTDAAVSDTNGSVKEAEDSKSPESMVEAIAADTAADTVSDIQKNIRRAEQFGISVQLTEKEKRNFHAERFGTGSTVGGSEVSKKTEELKRKARAERFGLSASVTSVASDEEAKNDNYKELG